jgi:predicted nucleotidyltransferase
MILTSEQIQSALDEVCPKYDAIKWTLFGSYAYGTATEDSDVDVLVEFKEKPKSYHERMQISIELEELLGKRVDVIIAPITRKSIFKLGENGVPMFVTSEERTHAYSLSLPDTLRE